MQELFAAILAALAGGLTDIDVERFGARLSPKPTGLASISQLFFPPSQTRRLQDASIGLIEDAVAPWNPRRGGGRDLEHGLRRGAARPPVAGDDRDPAGGLAPGPRRAAHLTVRGTRDPARSRARVRSPATLAAGPPMRYSRPSEPARRELAGGPRDLEHLPVLSVLVGDRGRACRGPRGPLAAHEGLAPRWPPRRRRSTRATAGGPTTTPAAAERSTWPATAGSSTRWSPSATAAATTALR